MYLGLISGLIYYEREVLGLDFFREVRILLMFVERFCKDLKYKQWSLIMRCWFNNHVEMLKGAKIRKKLSKED